MQLHAPTANAQRRTRSGERAAAHTCIMRLNLLTYINNTDFHLRPLSKLTHDIAKDLGLI
jgi:hypothetical protein